MNIKYPVLVILLLAVEANADNSTLDAAFGGGIGGAAGAAIGNEVGGRNGAIIGGALGGGIGAAVATDKEPDHAHARDTRYKDTRPLGGEPVNSFCPPGQAKKGRC